LKARAANRKETLMLTTRSRGRPAANHVTSSRAQSQNAEPFNIVGGTPVPAAGNATVTVAADAGL
jgi:hypothetical protein